MVHVLGVQLPDYQYARVRYFLVDLLFTNILLTDNLVRIDCILWHWPQNCTSTLRTSSNSRQMQSAQSNTSSNHRTCRIPFLTFYVNPTSPHATSLPVLQTSAALNSARGSEGRDEEALKEGMGRSIEKY